MSASSVASTGAPPAPPSCARAAPARDSPSSYGSHDARHGAAPDSAPEDNSPPGPESTPPRSSRARTCGTRRCAERRGTRTRCAPQPVLYLEQRQRPASRPLVPRGVVGRSRAACAQPRRRARLVFHAPARLRTADVMLVRSRRGRMRRRQKERRGKRAGAPGLCGEGTSVGTGRRRSAADHGGSLARNRNRSVTPEAHARKTSLRTMLRCLQPETLGGQRSRQGGTRGLAGVA